VLAAVAAGALHEQFPEIVTCDGQTAPDYQMMANILTQAKSYVHQQLESNHMVVVVPKTAAHEHGESMISARLYASLPLQPGGTGFETSMTKVVLVGVDEDGESEGLYIPNCGEFWDEGAAKTLKAHAGSMVNGPSFLASKATDTLINQTPFINMILGERLKGNVLPLVLSKQSYQLAQQTGDLLASLVGTGGAYQAERVLFVFAADLSHNLEKQWAKPRDTETVTKMTSEGFGAVLKYFQKMKEVSVGDEHRRPYDYGSCLGAVKLAENLALRGASIAVANSGDFIGATDRNDMEIVRGYASVVYLRDDRTKGEIASATAEAPELPPKAADETTAPPTTPPPTNTLAPAPFGTNAAGDMTVPIPQGFLQRVSKSVLRLTRL